MKLWQINPSRKRVLFLRFRGFRAMPSLKENPLATIQAEVYLSGVHNMLIAPSF